MNFDPDAAFRRRSRSSPTADEGSSTAELLERMGIARQSLYGAFGDKRRLFLKALERYNATSVAELVEALGSKRNGIKALEAALLAFARPGAEPWAGCLGIGSIAEFGRSDPDINVINDASAADLLRALADHVRRGMTAGEITKRIDPDAAARFLLALRSGLKIAARAGAETKELREMVRVGLAVCAPDMLSTARLSRAGAPLLR